MISLRSLGRETPVMVFDVESIGLHGAAYAVGYVVIQHGKEVESGMYACPSVLAFGTESDRKWVNENIPPLEPNLAYPSFVREKFWATWRAWNKRGALLAADCGWPVEARFLGECVDVAHDERRFEGPYPFLEISSILLARGKDPMATYPRLETELPVHNPVADARQSARLLMEAIHGGSCQRCSKLEKALQKFVDVEQIFGHSGQHKMSECADCERTLNALEALKRDA